MSDNKIASIGKGILYVIVLIVCTVALLACFSKDIAFIHIPISGIMREIGSAIYENRYFTFGILIFMCFVCPGWLLSQIIFKGHNEVRNFTIYTSAPLVIIITLSFIGYLAFDDSGSFLSAQDMFGGFIKVAAIIEVPVIIVALLGALLLAMFRKRTVNVIIGSLFIFSYFFLTICYSSVE